MAKIVYILLSHKDPGAVIRQAETLTAAGDYMVIHFDGRSAHAHYEQIRKALTGNANVILLKRRVKCGWGEWSLVQATCIAARAALEAFGDATHFYMLSGDCMAIKSAQYMHRFLDENDADFIENYDFFESDWIKTGMKEERLTFRHFFNERKKKRLFYASMEVQRWLKLHRKPPEDLEVKIGSQWWCLRRDTVEKVLNFVKKRRDAIRFFSTTWIPDETFFQTIVPHLIPGPEIQCRPLTFLLFTDYGVPVTFYNDHYDMLIRQDFLFARKISPQAKDLKRRLELLFPATGVPFQISNEGANLFKFLTERGRIGTRFASRFWETESTLGRERELMIVVCKKWHVAKRVLEEVRQVTNIPAIAYLFNEENTPLPDLGGIQTSLEKRTRHRRALVRMLFDFYETDRMMICVDPGNLELLHDFTTDRCITRVLEIECVFSDAYLAGHASRVGLAGAQTPRDTLERLLPTIRNDIMFESDCIYDANFRNYNRIRETGALNDNTNAMAAFLSISHDAARGIAANETLFAD